MSTIPQTGLPTHENDGDNSPLCRRCGHFHSRFSQIEWTWQVRDMAVKPPRSSFAHVLHTLASRMNPRSGCGFCSSAQLASDTGLSLRTVTLALAWAREAGLVERMIRGHRIPGKRATASLWHLRPITSQETAPELGLDNHQHALDRSLSQTSTTTKPEDLTREEADASSLGRAPENQARPAQAELRTITNPEEPSMAKTAPAPVADALPGMDIEPQVRQDTGTLIAEWLAHCKIRPPERIIKIAAREVKLMLGEGIDYQLVRQGMARWHRKRAHPTALASFVNEVMQQGAPDMPVEGVAMGRSTTDERVAQGLALARKHAELDGTPLPVAAPKPAPRPIPSWFGDALAPASMRRELTA